MVKTLQCGDVFPGCDAEFDASDEPAVLAQAALHAIEQHEVTELDDDTVAAVRAAIRDG